MVDPITTRTWSYRLLYVILMLTIVFFQLLPVGMGAGKIPGPDLTVALTFAWVLRRPSYVPLWLIFVLFLSLDLLLQRPPGLGTALILLGSESLRSKRKVPRTMPFMVEWAFVTIVMLALVVLNQIALAAVLVDRPPLGLALLRAIFTAAAYPFIVLLSHYALGISAADPAEADALGNRL